MSDMLNKKKKIIESVLDGIAPTLRINSLIEYQKAMIEDTIQKTAKAEQDRIIGLIEREFLWTNNNQVECYQIKKSKWNKLKKEIKEKTGD